MAKKVQAMLKLQVPAAKAAPSQQLGTALGPQGVNIMDFCKQFNARTAKDPEGMVTPVVITVYSDRTFTFITKTPPASELLKRAANIVKGSADRIAIRSAKLRRNKFRTLQKPSCLT